MRTLSRSDSYASSHPLELRQHIRLQPSEVLWPQPHDLRFRQSSLLLPAYRKWYLLPSTMDLSRVDPALYNPDLAPIPEEKRSWGTYNYASLWVAMSVCIPTYMLASGLIAGGMNWYQAVGTILLGNLIVLIPMLLNAHAGTRYGIPFPVFVRASFGVRGANVPAVLRALVACGWFGIQTWIGGQAIYSMLQIVLPGIAQ